MRFAPVRHSGYNGRNRNSKSASRKEVWAVSFSLTFWIIMVVIALILATIFTASYNDDKTKGL